MPQIETRVVLVQEAGKREELLKALEVCGPEIKQSPEGCVMPSDFWQPICFCTKVFLFHRPLR